MKKIELSDILNFNYSYRSGYKSFSIPCVTESIVPDDHVLNIQRFIEDEGFRVDEFNTEYMGFLTGMIDATDQQLIDLLNKYFKNNEKQRVRKRFRRIT